MTSEKTRAILNWIAAVGTAAILGMVFVILAQLAERKETLHRIETKIDRLIDER